MVYRHRMSFFEKTSHYGIRKSLEVFTTGILPKAIRKGILKTIRGTPATRLY